MSMRTYRHLLRKPHLIRMDSGLWFCLTRDGWMVGVGVTPKEAYEVAHL